MAIAERIARNTFFNFVATAVNVCLAMVLSIVLARVLGIEEYGIYSFFIWVITLTGFAVNLGLGSMANKYVSEALGRRNEAEARGVIRLALLGRLIAALVLAGLILALASRLTHLFGKGETVHYMLVACTVLPYTLDMLFASTCMGFQRFQYIAYHAMATTPLRVALSVLLVALGFGVVALLIVNLVTFLVGIAVGLFLVGRLTSLKKVLSQKQLGRETRAKAIKFSLAMAGVMAAGYLLWERAEVFFLGLYRPAEEVGFYILAFKLPTLAMALVPIVFSAVLMPAVSEQFGRNDMAKVRSIYVVSAKYLTMLAMPLAIGLVVLAEPLVNLMYGADYRPVILLMRIVCIPIAIYALLGGTSAVIIGINRPSYALKVGVILAALSVGINFLLVPRYGALGAAAGTSAVQVLAFPAYVWYVNRQIGALWPLRDTLGTALASCVMGLALFLLYHYLGTAWALALAIPVGSGLYFAGLVLFAVLRDEDVTFLHRAQPLLPGSLRKNYGAAVGLAERLVHARQCF